MRQSSLEEVCDAIGYRATRVIAAWFAGRRFYVPLNRRQDHPLVQLLNHPNPYMSRGQLWSTVVMDRYLAGNAFLLKALRKCGR